MLRRNGNQTQGIGMTASRVVAILALLASNLPAVTWAAAEAASKSPSQSIDAADRPVLETEQQKTDYALGVNMGRNLVNQGIKPDVDWLVLGLRDALAGRALLLSDAEFRQVTMAFRAEMRRNQVRSQQVLAEENFKAGAAFMAENSSREGVVSLPSGLQYRVLTEGSGPIPKETDTVIVNYRGRLLDGTEFDSSYRNGEPATFNLKATIPGFRQALMLMPVGSKWEVYVPPGLAYGPKGTGLGVGPQATLIFEIELVGIR
jgi:FKBP-type peptidyl-prolyl cis-trans isomerase FklB